MFCSACGQQLAPGVSICDRCARPVAPQVPPVPGMQLELAGFANRIKALSTVWFIYAAISLAFGFVGMAFARHFILGHGHGFFFGPDSPPWIGAAIQFGWIFLVLRSALALAAGYGLMERAPWGRVVAIVAAILNLLKFPLGTALGIWTLIVLLGYRNSALYEQIS